MIWITFNMHTGDLYVRAQVKKSRDVQDLIRRLVAWGKWISSFRQGPMPAETKQA